MTTSAPDFTAAQEQLLDSIRRSQQAVVDAVRAYTEASAKSAPAVPAPPLPADLPQPQEVVAGTFDFAEKLLATQRDFAEQLLAASTPAPATPKAAKK